MISVYDFATGETLSEADPVGSPLPTIDGPAELHALNPRLSNGLSPQHHGPAAFTVQPGLALHSPGEDLPVQHRQRQMPADLAQADCAHFITRQSASG